MQDTSFTRVPYDRMIITLYQDKGQWFALYSGNGSEEIRHLFGTSVLPTPFTSASDPDAVYQTVSRLNPNCLVMLESEGN